MVCGQIQKAEIGQKTPAEGDSANCAAVSSAVRQETIQQIGEWVKTSGVQINDLQNKVQMQLKQNQIN